ncbi:hypothetical protein BC829DRAFT_418559 [Chytridium lagenaria]|nr:hypothetical protein BC829DRAFT_418559 [Chytridium lagenaria]
MDAGADFELHESGEGETIASDRGAFGSEAAVSDLMTEATRIWKENVTRGSHRERERHYMRGREGELTIGGDGVRCRALASAGEVAGEDFKAAERFRKMGRGAEALRRCKIAERKSDREVWRRQWRMVKPRTKRPSIA